MANTNYEIEQATVWCGLEEVYSGCVNFERHHRIPIEEAAKILTRSSNGLSENFDVVHLKVSQGTAIEHCDQRIAARLNENTEHASIDGPVRLESVPANDATNACAFITVKIADRLLGECRTEGEFFADLAEVVDDTIWNLPVQINAHRDLNNMYDTLEAYAILSEQMLVGCYEFSEELPFADSVFSLQGRQKLHAKLCHLGRDDFIAIFTSDPFVVTIGCQHGRPIIIDTHPVTLAPGKGSGLLMIGKQNSPEVWKSLCVWLWQRLNYGGVKPDTSQSRAVVSPKTK